MLYIAQNIYLFIKTDIVQIYYVKWAMAFSSFGEFAFASSIEDHLETISLSLRTGKRHTELIDNGALFMVFVVFLSITLTPLIE